VDPLLDKMYSDLTKRNSIGWKERINGIERNVSPPPHLASIREICFEIIETLNKLDFNKI
jgi:hypothetical protein